MLHDSTVGRGSGAGAEAPAAAPETPSETPGGAPAPPLLAERRAAAFWILLAASVVGSLASIPYALDIMTQSGASFGRDEAMSAELTPVLLLVGLVTETVLFSVPAAGLGLLAAPRTGLGAPLLQGWLARRAPAAGRVRSAALAATVVGAAVGVILTVGSVAGEALVPAMVNRAIEHPPAWSSLLASAGAAVREEVWMRLGAMGVVVWLLMGFGGRLRPAAWMVWTGNVTAALLFGVLHLPQAAMLVPDGALGAEDVAFVLAANGIAAVSFGWLYWRHGLLAAMGGHLVTDLVLHVAAPALLGW